MSNKKNFIKEAEQNVLNYCKELYDFIKVLDGFFRIGNNFLQTEENKNDFFAGLKMMRYAIYDQYIRAINMTFNIVGVGGKEAFEYAKERAKEAFAENHAIMQYLNKYCDYPPYYNASDEKEFRNQLKEKMENKKNNN